MAEIWAENNGFAMREPGSANVGSLMISLG
jgi:hypothetical protein